MAEDLGERTEHPTSRKLSDAREKGQNPKSQELSAAIELIGGVLMLVVLGAWLTRNLGGMTRDLLAGERFGVAPDTDSVIAMITWVGARAAVLIGPILLIAAAVVICATLSQIGWFISTEPLVPKLDRLNPGNGIKKLVSRRNLTKTILSIIKLSFVAFIAITLIRRDMPMIVALPALPLLGAAKAAGAMIGELLAWVLAALLLLGLIDCFYQRWQHRHDLRMTRQEVKDERKSLDGDPDVKARRMKLGRQLILQRIQHAVPTADVIVTNPTHYAVALRYDADTMDAPRVVAKGADDLALRIRQLAAEHNIPIVERPVLARGLYARVDVGRTILPQFYEAVAEILAYVYRLEHAAA